ncbi:uncharacterized protein LOC18438671 isoform X1 [Amborella trichopoda]|uniref:DUF7811 domain-containing protein n=1 Tax=Amborella trichopoda TaxID=13333 RepID=W1PRM6_AMBTC|nr:uncharacterized protein LOC18438671 isoform X1 [Amborella trichopoda]ERN10499.1 hypothetical protein AMTR_s00161p00074080 [Amborella trichopoda]|eukprot:XP_006848918.1 uncharacterized protein LOC18438671 isoform X1 [Amborella trichopoda]
MADSSALCCSSLSSCSRSFANPKPFSSSQLSSSCFLRLFPGPLKPSLLFRSSAKDNDGDDWIGDDHFRYPWEKEPSLSDNDIQWVQCDRVTLFTADGLVNIGGSLIPQRVQSSDKKLGKGKASPRFQRFQERDYMDPKQGLCLGALFDIAATNGLNMGRRFCIFGFCRSIEMLSDVVEDAVIEHGGEVVTTEKASEGGLQEKLTMTVAVPLLWGVPPASESLHVAVRSGGGIVEKVYWQWDFF